METVRNLVSYYKYFHPNGWGEREVTPYCTSWRHENGARIDWYHVDSKNKREARNIELGIISSTIVYSPRADAGPSDKVTLHLGVEGLLTDEQYKQNLGYNDEDLKRILRYRWLYDCKVSESYMRSSYTDGPPIFAPGEYMSIGDVDHPQAR